jgi:hypothetical protein
MERYGDVDVEAMARAVIKVRNEREGQRRREINRARESALRRSLEKDQYSKAPLESSQPTPHPTRYTSAPGVDNAALGHTYTAEDRDWYQKQQQDAKDRARIWREGRWD